MELFQEHGGRLKGLELRKESGESDWKLLEGVRWCSGAQCQQASKEGKVERSSCSKLSLGWGLA